MRTPSPRPYQYHFSELMPSMYDAAGRRRKAETMLRVLADALGDTRRLRLLDVGASTGIIAEFLSHHFAQVVAGDIDRAAIEHAGRSFSRPNLQFLLGDSMLLPFAEASFDVVVCAQVYEHVPDPRRMIAEIRRVLRPGGACYFAAGNRIHLIEPHYSLPLLSLLPRPLAHHYLRLCGKGQTYHEQFYSYWGLMALTRGFARQDYTLKVIAEPERYRTAYMVGSEARRRAAAWVARHAYWAMPGYIWLLRKPAGVDPGPQPCKALR
jgi:ubiquinone/menaquinone biosynthesis C-methylase UbiE